MNFFTIFIKNLSIIISTLLLITNSSLSQQNISLPSKNLVFHEKTKDFMNITLLDKKNNKDFLIKFDKKITIINFWATWCAPCKEEMPSLNRLVDILGQDNIQVIAVNIEGTSYSKAKSFLNELKITNFDVLFDQDLKLVKNLSLRGVPTTLLINEHQKEFARVIGSIDFMDEKFIKWIKNF